MCPFKLQLVILGNCCTTEIILSLEDLPLLANKQLHKNDERIKGEAKFTNVTWTKSLVREIQKSKIDEKLKSINVLHDSLKFSCKTMIDCSIPFLDIQILRNNCKLSTIYYAKLTNAGLSRYGTDSSQEINYFVPCTQERQSLSSEKKIPRKVLLKVEEFKIIIRVRVVTLGTNNPKS